MHNSLQKQIIELIKRSQKILILPSSPADGDSIGSAIALYIVLRKLQKDPTILSSEPIPEVFDFLPNIKAIGNKLMSSNDFIITVDLKSLQLDKVKTLTEDDKLNIIISPKEGTISQNDVSFNKGEIAYDLIITVDCAELTQLGQIYENNIEMFHRLPVVNIDHHISNAHFGKLNYIDIMSSSTTELLLPLIEELARQENLELIDEDVATLLLTGIITDTGSFQNANTTPRAFEVASELVAYGARQQEIIQYIYKTKQLSQLKLWGRVLSKIQTDEKHKIVWSVVSQQDFRDTGSLEDETGDIIDELMTNAPGAEMIFLMKEKKDGTISVSMRTTTPAVDAAKIAESFGGGGHTQAAGFRLTDMDLIAAEYKVLTAVRTAQAERLNIQEHESTTPITERDSAPARTVVAPKKTPVASPEKPKGKKKNVIDPFEFKATESEKSDKNKPPDESPAYRFES